MYGLSLFLSTDFFIAIMRGNQAKATLVVSSLQSRTQSIGQRVSERNGESWT